MTRTHSRIAGVLVAATLGGGLAVGPGTRAQASPALASTTTTVATSTNPSAYGQSITFTATVTSGSPGTPTGTLTLFDGSGAIATGGMTSGTSVFVVSDLVAGDHTITATYNGDSTFASSTGSLTGNPQVVDKADTTTSGSSTTNPSTYGSPTTFIVSVSAGYPVPSLPTGDVNISDGGTPIGAAQLLPGAGGFTTSTLSVGSHNIVIAYAGDANFNPSAPATLSNDPQVVRAFTTAAVTTSGSPSAPGTPVTFTVTVSSATPGTPTGNVTFFDGSVALAGLQLSGGSASFTTAGLSPGHHDIQVMYFGDPSDGPSTGQLIGGQDVIAAPVSSGGYWLVGADGGVFPFGSARGFGSTGTTRLNQPVVGIAGTPDDGGYWLVAADGGIFPFGDAGGYGSTGGIRLNKPVVGMAATPDGHGYWLVASDGGIFPFGDADGYGSLGATRLNAPITGMAATADGRGYWLVAADGGVFPFGDAGGFGSLGAVHIATRIVGMARSVTGEGYRLAGANGFVAGFGDAGLGSSIAPTPSHPIVGLAAAAPFPGYWLAGSDGAVYPFGGAMAEGSTAGVRLNKPMVGIAAAS